MKKQLIKELNNLPELPTHIIELNEFKKDGTLYNLRSAYISGNAELRTTFDDELINIQQNSTVPNTKTSTDYAE